jgi:hypothetical protein
MINIWFDPEDRDDRYESTYADLQSFEKICRHHAADEPNRSHAARHKARGREWATYRSRHAQQRVRQQSICSRRNHKVVRIDPVPPDSSGTDSRSGGGSIVSRDSIGWFNVNSCAA